MAIPFDPLSGLLRTTTRTKTTRVGGLAPGTVPVTVGAIRTLEPTHALAARAYGAQGILDTPTGPITVPKLTAAPSLTPPAAAPAAPAPAAAASNGAPAPADLQALIETDPLYKQTQADIAAQRISDQASRSAARQRQLVLYGAIPDLAQSAGALGLVGSDIGGDITDTTRELADKNTAAGLSTTARLKQASDDVIKQVKDQLTARGLLSSGETGYQLGRQDLASRQAGYDALQQLLDALAGYQSGYLSNENQRQAALAAAAQAAAGRIPTTTAGLTGPGTTGVGGPGSYVPLKPGDPLGQGGDFAPANIGDFPWLAAHPGDPGYGLTALPVPDEPFQPIAVGSNLSFEPHLGAAAGASAYGGILGSPAAAAATAAAAKKRAAAQAALIQQAYDAAIGRNRFG